MCLVYWNCECVEAYGDLWKLAYCIRGKSCCAVGSNIVTCYCTVSGENVYSVSMTKYAVS